MGPEMGREVGGEVGVAVFRGSEDVGIEVDSPELLHVVHDDEVGIEVDNAGNSGGEEIGEVDARVIERLVERSADGGGDEVANEGGVEAVEPKIEVRKGGDDGGVKVPEVSVDGEEVEEHVFRASGVLENGENGGDGAPEVRGGIVKSHGYVDCR